MRTKTRNIAQNDSIDDIDSVAILVKQLQDLAVSSKEDERKKLRSIIREINCSDQYVSNVMDLLNTISRLDKDFNIVNKYIMRSNVEK